MAGKTETAVVEVILKGQAANASLKEMEKSAAALRAQLRRMPADSEEFARKSAEFQKVQARIKEVNNELKGTSGLFARLGIDMRTFGGVLAGVIGGNLLTTALSKIGSFFTGMVKGNAELSDSFADIQKTTGMTTEEVEKLNKALGQLNTRTSTADLRKIAVGAGQLGIAKKDILGFTAAIDKMVVSLGDEFGGGAEEITRTMGGLRNIFSDIKTDKIDQDMLHIGNAVNALGAAGMATGPVVTDFATRIGGVGISLGLTSGQVLGLSATLQELSVGTEKGGTAVVKILQRMTTHTEEFAKVANMDVKSFTELVNKDLFQAFTKVVEGSKQSGSSATALGKILDALGVDGAGASEVMAKLGGNTSLLKEKVDLAGQSLQGTSSIMEEFNTKNNNMAGDLDKLGKNLSRWFTNSTLMNGMKGMVHWLSEITDNTIRASHATEQERRELLVAETQILSYNVGNKERTKLIKELQDKYPDYLGNINAETVSHEDLSAAINKVNNSLLNKIMIQQMDEEMADDLERTAAAKIRAAKAMVDMQKQLSYVFENARGNLKSDLSGLPTEVAVEEVLKYDTYTQAGLSRFNQHILDLASSYEEWKDATLEANKASIVSNELEARKQAVMKSLGITMDSVLKKQADIKKGGGSTAGVTPDKAILAEHERLIADLQKMNIETSEMDSNEYSKRFQQVWREHQETLKRINADTVMSQDEKEKAIIALKLNTSKKMQKIDEDAAAKEKEEREKLKRDMFEALANDEQKEVNAVEEKYNSLIARAKQHGLDTAELEEEKQRLIFEIRQKYALKGKEAGHPDALTEKERDEKWKKDLDNYRMYIGQLEQIGQMLFQIEQNKLTVERNRNEEKYQQDIAREKALLDRKIISQEDYDKRVQKLEQEKENRDRLAAQRQYAMQKQAGRYTAILNGAQAITSILAQYPKFDGGIAMAAALIGAGALTAAQIAIIESQEPPKFAAGGFVTQETLLPSASGRNFIAGEAGSEYVVPNWMLNQPIIANQVAMMEAIRTNRGFTQPGASGASSIGSGNNAISFGELAAAIQRLNANLEGGIGVNYDMFTKTMASIDNAKAISSIN